MASAADTAAGATAVTTAVSLSAPDRRIIPSRSFVLRDIKVYARFDWSDLIGPQ